MATFSGAEDFESYSNTSNLNGGSGGSGWGGNWTNNVGNGFIITNVSPGQGSQNVNVVSGLQAGIYRAVGTPPSDSSTIVHLMMNDSLAVAGKGDTAYFQEAIGSGGYLAVSMDGAGGISVAASGGTSVSLGSYTASTWYHLYVDLDVTNKKIRGYASTTIPHTTPTFSSYTTASSGTISAINFVQLSQDDPGAQTSAFDDIRDVGTDFTPLAASAAFVPQFLTLRVG